MPHDNSQIMLHWLCKGIFYTDLRISFVGKKCLIDYVTVHVGFWDYEFCFEYFYISEVTTAHHDYAKTEEIIVPTIIMKLQNHLVGLRKYEGCNAPKRKVWDGTWNWESKKHAMYDSNIFKWAKYDCKTRIDANLICVKICRIQNQRFLMTTRSSCFRSSFFRTH